MHGKGARVDLHRDKAYIYTKKKEKKKLYTEQIEDQISISTATCMNCLYSRQKVNPSLNIQCVLLQSKIYVVRTRTSVICKELHTYIIDNIRYILLDS